MKLLVKRKTDDNYSSANYWSSTENNSNNAWNFNGSNGNWNNNGNNNNNKTNIKSVRPGFAYWMNTIKAMREKVKK